jgi:hypothetical protein
MSFLVFWIMNPKQLPLKLAQDTQNLLKTIRKVQADNSDVVEIKSQDGVTITLKDSTSDFYFEISEPSYSNSISYFKINFNPVSEHAITPATFTENSAGVLKAIGNWIDLIKQFNEVTWTEEDVINKFYEKEFDAEFDNVDEGAANEPFATAEQEKINTFLVRLIGNAKAIQHAYKVDEIIEQAEQLKKDLPISTTKKFIRGFRKLVITIKKSGVEVAKELFKEGLKEAVKYALTQGYQHVI